MPSKSSSQVTQGAYAAVGRFEHPTWAPSSSSSLLAFKIGKTFIFWLRHGFCVTPGAAAACSALAPLYTPTIHKKKAALRRRFFSGRPRAWACTNKLNPAAIHVVVRLPASAAPGHSRNLHRRHAARHQEEHMTVARTQRR